MSGRDWSPAKTAVSVMGAGTMGHAIALVFALGGYRVTVFDPSEEARSQAGILIQSALKTLSGWVPRQKLEKAGMRIRYFADAAKAIKSADIIIETVTEDPQIKADLYELIAVTAPENAVLLSNTSYLDIFPLVPDTLKSRCLIAHWYAPPYIIDLVDVVAGSNVPKDLTDSVVALLEGLGKSPVVLERFIPGFVANRIQLAITLEALRLMDSGAANAVQIDQAIMHGLSLRLPVVGHLGKADFTGLEIMRRALANGSYEPPQMRSTSNTLEALFSLEKTGVAAGAGFYDWRGMSPEELIGERDLRFLKLKRAINDVGNMIDDFTAEKDV